MEKNLEQSWWSRRSEGEKIMVTLLVAIIVMVGVNLIYTRLIKKDTSNIISVIKDFKFD